MTAAALLLVTVSVPGFAPNGGEYRVDRVTIEDGLSQSSVYCLLEDRHGFLWIGGEYGLNRYDGLEFTVFTHDPADPASLGSNQIRAIHEDPNGRLWVGTMGGGLCRLDDSGHSFERFRHDPGDPRTLAGNDVRALASTLDGLWVATDQGVDLLAPGASSFEHVAGPSGIGTRPSGAQAIAADGAGRVWVGFGDTGLAVRSPGGDRFLPAITGPEAAIGLAGESVIALLVARDGSLWVGFADRGLAQLAPDGSVLQYLQHEAGTVASLSGDRITALTEGGRGYVWAGTAANGLNRVDTSSGDVLRIGVDPDNDWALSNAWVGALVCDRSDILWIGTDFGGLNRIDLKGTPFRRVGGTRGGPDLTSRVVFAILEDRDGDLWVGTHRGLDRIDSESGEVEHLRERFPRLGRWPVYALLETRDGSLWIGMWLGGLARLDSERQNIEVFTRDAPDPESLAHSMVLALAEGVEGEIWIGTWGGGLDRWDPATGAFTHHRLIPGDSSGISSNYVRNLMVDSSGSVWAGTLSGLNMINRDGAVIRRFLHRDEDPRSLSDDAVSCAVEGRDGVIWVGTAGGLNRLDDREKGRFAVFRTGDGLANEAVTGVVEDDAGRLWIAHFRGVSRFDPATLEVVNFDAGQGLRRNEYNSGAFFRSRAGEIFFGGVQGMTVFHPDEVGTNPRPPLMAVTSMRVEERELDLGFPVVTDRPILLDHTQDHVSFEFVGLEMTAPRHQRYAYRMVGLDRSWVDSEGRRYANYANLGPGRYSFQVKASNNDGLWSEEPAKVDFVIEPPFWLTWWFRVALGAVLAAAVAVAWVGRTHALRRRLEEQEELVEKRTRQLAVANAELEAQATRDGLTQVANRRRFDAFIDEEWRRAARFGRPLSVIMADLDHFKEYNDARGHQAGDECLRRVARALAASVRRPGDLLARYGGEEFVAVLTEDPAEAARELTERMRLEVEGLAILHPAAGAGVVTVSLGVATTNATPSADWTGVVAAADRALYQAKAEGRNRVVAVIV